LLLTNNSWVSDREDSNKLCEATGACKTRNQINNLPLILIQLIFFRTKLPGGTSNIDLLDRFGPVQCAQLVRSAKSEPPGGFFSTFTGMKTLVQSQQTYFRQGKTLPLKTRKEALLRLYKLLRENEGVLADAIHKDLRKSFYLTVQNELSLPYGEIRTALRKLRYWSRPRYRRTNLVNFYARTRVVPVPFGVSLVIGPWNYPYMLSLVPAISALAAGNTVILKPSEITLHSSRVLAELVNGSFPGELFHVVEGGPEETAELLQQDFDKIFFTGSSAVGRIVMRAAAEKLTPVTLELGGKNPVIVLPDCNLKMAARRITWGKFHNNGMACVAPDHVYVHESVRKKFIEEVTKSIPQILGTDPRESIMLPRMANRKHYNRVMGLINPEKVILGGKGNPEDLYIEPTVMDGISDGDDVMQEEVFGPVMPVLAFTDLQELVNRLTENATPLMLYVFSGNTRQAWKLAREIPSGGAMVNEVVLQFINMDSPFGGKGESGMGQYHGKAGFEAFSHMKTIMHKPGWFELFLKYPPHRDYHLHIFRAVLGKSLRNLRH